MKKFAPWFMLLALFSFSFAAFAQSKANDAVPQDALHGMHPIHANNSANANKNGNIPTPHAFPAGTDTITNFTGHFENHGILFDGTAHHVWEYSMVGNPPEQGGTTVFNAPIVPVSLDLRDANGNPRFVKLNSDGSVSNCANSTDAGCKPLFSNVTSFIQPFVNGPVFNGLSTYSSSPVPTQITDAVQRAEFGNHARADWHTLLSANVKAPETMVLNQVVNSKGLPTYQFALNSDGSCCFFVLINGATFERELFPQTAFPDASTIIGQAEVNNQITTKDISTFLFPNAYLFEGSLNNCCVLGFHTFDFELGNAPNLPPNGNLQRFYVLNYSSWITPGIFGGGFQDITANSHEIAETFNDPFVGFDNIHNIVPFWLNPAGQCQDLMEDGDVIEDLSNFGSVTFPVTVNNFTYHPQNEALLPWFEFEQNSSAIDHAYSYPNEAILPHLSAPQPLNCGGQ